MASGIGGRPGPRWGRASCRRLQPVDDRDQDVLCAPVLEFVHHREPELGPFVLGDPETQNLAQPITGDAEGDIHGLVLHRPAVGIADLHPQGIEDHDRIHPLQRPALPVPDLGQDGVGDPADQIGRDLQAIEVEQMGLDIPHR